MMFSILIPYPFEYFPVEFSIHFLGAVAFMSRAIDFRIALFLYFQIKSSSFSYKLSR